MTIIAGYTTQDKKFEKLVDKEIIKHDLMMNLFIKKGECDWNPELGTTIEQKIFQIKTEDVKADIIEEITAVINNNNFVTLQNISTVELEKGWIFNVVISYYNNEVEELSIPITEETIKANLSQGHYPLVKASNDS